MKVIAISGPSCSGKSTLSRHLRQVLPHAVLVYEDDFYLPDDQIPKDPESGLEDWDCPEAFDLGKLRQVLETVHKSGKLPDQFVSTEENNDRGEDFLTAEQRKQLRAQFKDVEPIVILDGIMLFHEQSPLWKDMDVKILMPAAYDELKSRRSARSGYATKDGFWADPPGYFDKIVWPQFLKNYQYLYDVTPDTTLFNKLSQAAINEQVELAPTTDMVELLEWTVKRVAK